MNVPTHEPISALRFKAENIEDLIHQVETAYRPCGQILRYFVALAGEEPSEEEVERWDELEDDEFKARAPDYFHLTFDYEGDTIECELTTGKHHDQQGDTIIYAGLFRDRDEEGNLIDIGLGLASYVLFEDVIEIDGKGYDFHKDSYNSLRDIREGYLAIGALVEVLLRCSFSEITWIVQETNSQEQLVALGEASEFQKEYPLQ